MKIHINCLNRIFYKNLSLLLFLIIPNTLLSQSKDYYASWGKALTIEKDSFCFVDLMADLPWHGYPLQHVYALGSCTIKNGIYYLNADDNILDNQGVCTNFIASFEYDTAHNNKISIEFNSPYEEEIKTNHYHRVYNYHVSFYISQNGKDTIITSSDTLEKISAARLPNGKLKKLEVIITYHPTYYATGKIFIFTTQPWCKMTIDSIPEKTNSIKIEMPTFEYFSLSYANYQNYVVPIKKNTFFNGQGFVLGIPKISPWRKNRMLNLFMKFKYSKKGNSDFKNDLTSRPSISKYFFSNDKFLVVKGRRFYAGNQQIQSTSQNYPSQKTHSFGYQLKRGGKYHLYVDKKITENQGECANFIASFEYDTAHNNKISIEFNSPYEEEIKTNHYHRVYNYHVSFYISQNGKDTIITSSDTLEKISAARLPNGKLKKLEVIITYHPTYYATGKIFIFTTQPWCKMTIDSIPEKTNSIKIEMPTFEYFSLSYANLRRNYIIPIRGKTSLFQGCLFYKTKENDYSTTIINNDENIWIMN